MIRSTHAVIPPKIGVLELVRYIRRKDDRHKAAHSNVGEEHKKYNSEKKLSPQVHTADIPQDLRTHMDK